jgi:hypothetical protein
MRRSGKARDRGVIGEYGEEAERGRSGCSGVRMQAYLRDGVLRLSFSCLCAASRFFQQFPPSLSLREEPWSPSLVIA